VITTNPLKVKTDDTRPMCTGCEKTIEPGVPFMAIEIFGFRGKYCPECVMGAYSALYEAYRRAFPIPNVPIPGINDNDDDDAPRVTQCPHCQGGAFEVTLLDVEPWEDTLVVDQATREGEFQGPDRIPQGGADLTMLRCVKCRRVLWSNPYA